MTKLSHDDIAFAAEYALGLLDRAETASAAARVASDTDFATEVENWRTRLQPMLDGPDVSAPDYVWDRIKDGIPAGTLQDNSAKRLRLWQGISFASASAAAIMAALLYFQPVDVPEVPDKPVAPMIAALGSKTGTAAVTARYDAKNGQMLLTPVSLKTGALYPELWIIPADGKARSLGIVPGDHATLMDVPAAMREFFTEGTTLAITPEPAGGAPGGKATGPVIASGKIITV
jgi:anti-sigma-K factor RskA